MLIASASRTAAVAHSAFPVFSATTSSSYARSSAAVLPKFVIRQRRHSSSNKHSSRAKSQQQPPVASTPEQQRQQEQRGTRADAPSQAPQQSPSSGNKRGTRALKKTDGNGVQQQLQTKEKENGKRKAAPSQNQQSHVPKTADAIVTDVQAQLDSVAMPPSVPSTAHIDHKVVYLAKLFAQHRPISLNQPLPPQDGKVAFDNIFAPMSAKKKTQDVMFTLANAVKSLESAASSGANGSVKVVTPSPFDQSATASQAPTINLEELQKSFRPFNAPPAPIPLDPKYLNHQQQQQEQPSTKRTKKAIAVPTTSDTIAAVETPAAIETPPTPEGVTAQISEKPSAEGSNTSIAPTFRKRMHLRHGSWLAGWIQRMRDMAMQLISVKRQRKLKMKKHKYKKLMKRTRNLRRRLDRL